MFRAAQSLRVAQTLAGPSQRPFECRRYASAFSWLREKMRIDAKLESLRQRTRDEQTEQPTQQSQSLLEQAAAPEADVPARTTVVSEVAETSTKEIVLEPESYYAPNRNVSPRKAQFHQHSSEIIKTSHRKLQKLSDQINGKPLDWAILQMQFSEKRASTNIVNMLRVAKDRAIKDKHLNPARLIVAEAWVNKSIKGSTKLEPRARGHYGIRTKRRSVLKVVLKEGLTMEEKKAKAKAFKVNRVASAGLVREDKPLRNMGSKWAW